MNPGTYSIGGPRAGLNRYGEQKVPGATRVRTPDSAARHESLYSTPHAPIFWLVQQLSASQGELCFVALFQLHMTMQTLYAFHWKLMVLQSLFIVKPKHISSHCILTKVSTASKAGARNRRQNKHTQMLNSSVLCVVTWGKVVWYGRFGTTYRFHLQSQAVQEAWSLKMGRISSPETSVSNRFTSCNNQKARRIYSKPGRSLRSLTQLFYEGFLININRLLVNAFPKSCTNITITLILMSIAGKRVPVF
jgi:hypothetical protein